MEHERCVRALRAPPPPEEARCVRAQSRALLDEATQLGEQGDAAGARQKLELAVQASADAVEARVALAQQLWDCAASQEDLRQVEELLKAARGIAKASNSAAEAAQEPIAASKLARLLFQLGRDAEAEPLLVEHGFTHRLSSAVLSGGTFEGEGESASVAAQRDELMAIIDGALPLSMLTHLQSLFNIDAPFWREHRYLCKDTGYFSYTHTLDTPPANNLDQIMRYLWRQAIARFPAAARATRVEWWAHNRPHPSGHQLHFDSDNEGQGGVRNPLVTSGELFCGPTGILPGATRANQPTVPAPRYRLIPICSNLLVV
jgi:hypothetical protein